MATNATAKKVRADGLELKAIRMFEDNQGWIGFNANIYRHNKKIGTVEHDGRSMVYSYFYEDRDTPRDGISDDTINLLLEAKGK